MGRHCVSSLTKMAVPGVARGEDWRKENEENISIITRVVSGNRRPKQIYKRSIDICKKLS